MLVLTATIFVAGCQSHKTACSACSQKVVAASASQATTVPTPTPAPVVTAPAIARQAIRIKAGLASAFTDSAGNVWAAEQGFTGGESVERPDLAIVNTKDPGIYHAEHYSMESFTCPVANGKYLVKLHFCETFDGIEGSGQRVFSFNVQGQEFKDFDVFAKAGGALKAYVESVPVEITNGNLKITFTSNVENPQINGIEILPTE